MIVTPAITAEDRLAAARFLYEQYEKSGIIKPNAERLHQSTQAQHGPPYAHTFIGRIAASIVGTVTTVLDGDNYGLPSDQYFRPELDELRRKGLRLAEVCELAHEGGWNDLRDLQCHAYWAAADSGATWIICVVHPDDGRRYQALAGFERIGPEKRILNDQPAQLWVMPVKTKITGGEKRFQRYWIEHPPNETQE